MQAQVGIGTTNPDLSSMLDISSSNSGLLIPRVALVSTSDVSTIALPVTSLLVYNSGFAPNGYYYWNGTLWVQLAVTNSNWSLTGNTIASKRHRLDPNKVAKMVFLKHNLRLFDSN